MKKILCLILSLIFIFTLTACTNNSGEAQPVPDNTLSESNGSSSSSPSFPSQTPDPTELTPRISSSTELSDENTENYPIDFNSMVVKGDSGGPLSTGLTPLMKMSYTASEGKKLSTAKQSHSHGPASGGEPHHTVVDFQRNFDKYYAVTLDTVSDEKAIYLTFDCGYEYENLTASILDTLSSKKVPAAFFCTLDHIKAEPELITRMIKEGHIVGNHSTTHPSFAEISREQMVREIESTENYLRENFGYCARFFRFPAGEYTESALDLVASLGYMSVFWSVAYDDWNTETVRGKDYATEKVMSRLHDGAVILLHSVSKDNAAALGEIIDKAREQGYVFRSLEDLAKTQSG